MPSRSKQIQQLARRLFNLSLTDGAVSPERVQGVLDYLEKHPPPRPLPVLKAYRRLIAAELARREAVVEHAGAIDESTLRLIADAMTARYGCSITSKSKPNPALIAGLRVRVGDDVFDATIQSRLAALAGS